ncbi:protoporphyrinogen oxidase [Streptomyces sp. NPDC090052]|uniref:protoporphyrinogen oxidase n=1 Tax=unclassified Streptomyces TaxID=2593676 RepID=UPI00224DC22A|nr:MULTISPECIES: protoporphyrinogen oxidase [unclassified Streptomyces]MCX4723046.1 protoporphyrinogen oxidase [Streptomyces sp. NBC_01306]WSX45433.1 protoporphyrinogen oxidase [Streptomyces sp. NBC_00963]
MNADTRTAHVVVIGGGISGLAAALRLTGGGARVTVLEGTGRVGGKLHTGEIEGVRVDLGAESMLARRPEAVALAREAGLGDALQPPATSGAALWNRGALTPMPTGHVMGVPADAGRLGGVLSDEGLRRIGQDAELPPAEIGEDIALGEYVAGRMGREVVDRLVEPLLGGVYAGDVYRTSMRAAVPALYEAARTHPTLGAAVRSLQQRVTPASGPVFMGLDGGIGTLPPAVADAVRARGGEVLLHRPALELRRTADGWLIRTGGQDGGRPIEADAVVLAVPAWAASALLADEAPAASAELAAVEYASMSLVTLAFRRTELNLPDGTGFLVPPVDGHSIKASTFSSRKWAWSDADPELVVLRTSLGRYGDEEHLHREDADLVDLSLRDLGEAVGLTAKPVATEVTRWIGGLPQYPVGHLARVARVRDTVAALPGLRICGAAYDGVGIPACVASAERAAKEITATLASGTTGGAGE